MNLETFKFLVTTDNHMGYKENDHIRYKDSFRAFDESLKIAREKEADFILLGGDLFHTSRPSANVEHKCIKIIRKHMSSEAVRGTSFTKVSGRFSHFNKINHANFEDPNFTVPYPIFTIHGNHDDPTGPNALSVCEKLSACGLLNYFGGISSTDKEIVIEPIVLQKGKIKIALYGLGFIPDYKLKIAFDKGEVTFMEPPKDTYNVLVVHQNRIPLNKNKFIPDDMFPAFFHLIIRGHEHSTQSPELIPESDVKGLVYQPGSTVATSISVMEAAPKKVGFFTIKINNSRGNRSNLYNTHYELLDLTCCRAMIIRDISQKDIFNYIKTLADTNKISVLDFKKYSKQYIVEYIEKILKANCNSKKSIQFQLPLMRVRIEYRSKSERFDELEINSQFYPNRVANKDIVIFKKQKLKNNDKGEVENTTFIHDDDIDSDQDGEDLIEHINLGEEKRDTIDVMIENYFKDKPAEERLQALSLNEYTNAVKGSGDDGNVISKVLQKKKKEIFTKYMRAIENDTIAGKKFYDEDSVREWFVTAFGCDVAMISEDDEDMDIVVCD